MGKNIRFKRKPNYFNCHDRKYRKKGSMLTMITNYYKDNQNKIIEQKIPLLGEELEIHSLEKRQRA